MDPLQSSGSSPQESESIQFLPSLDLRFENHFSLFLIRPCSETGRRWLDDNVGDDSTRTFGNAIVCESRFVEAILRGAIDTGLEVR
jgi:hypothetical protein